MSISREKGDKAMKNRARNTRWATLPAFLCTALAVVLFVPVEGFGRHYGSIRSHHNSRDRYYYGRDATTRQLQQNKIEADEEARREPSREKRREEIEEERNAEVEAYLDSQEAIRSSSQAAINAPRGFFFRKPGSSTSRLPVGAVEVTADGRTYHYFSGVFYLTAGNRYVVVTAPVGAVVDALPNGHGTTEYGDKTYSYYYGTFFAEEGGKFEVAVPAPGVVVGYLPDGYNEMRDGEDDNITYEYGGVFYQAVFLNGFLAYMVVAG
jgi:hypothetical protein